MNNFFLVGFVQKKWNTRFTQSILPLQKIRDFFTFCVLFFLLFWNCALISKTNPPFLLWHSIYSHFSNVKCCAPISISISITIFFFIYILFSASFRLCLSLSISVSAFLFCSTVPGIWYVCFERNNEYGYEYGIDSNKIHCDCMTFRDIHTHAHLCDQ